MSIEITIYVCINDIENTVIVQLIEIQHLTPDIQNVSNQLDLIRFAVGNFN
jgi:hypothetical protein